MTAMELTAAEAWSRILERARAQLPEQIYRSWLEQTEPLALSQDQLAIVTHNEFAVQWIEKQYGSLLAQAAERLFGRPFTIAVHHQPREEGGGPGKRATARVAPPPPPPAASHPAPGTVLGTALNERYTFERFVVGANNQLAAAACRAVAEAPARMYNPLFIYGGVGLGKTHLMHAIGHAVLARMPDRRVAYVSSERFTNDLIAAIQEGRMAEFRRRYRDIDVLLIDDVQFLGEKERTQEEFFHTFNALYEAQRQIVLTSDRPPKEIPGLEERLVSRFEWGLVTDIKPPDLETRVAILRKKAEEDQLVLADEVLDFIARNCRSSVRELEGAIIKLLAYSSLTRREITIELAREALGGVLAADARPELTPDLIRTRVAQAWGVPVEALSSKRRTKDLTVPRQVAMYLMRQLLGLSLVEIGRLFGGRDHSTVIHSIEKVEQELASDEEFRARVEAIRAELAR
ncbi:MAG: chromosomal replication initiator protein DnaA [bacterium]|jgi:chromosomal replication initiator protein